MSQPARTMVALAAAIGLFGAAPSAQAGAKRPSISGLRCVPASTATCAGGKVQLEVGRKVQLRGRSLRRGMRVTFRWSRGALATTLAKDRTGWTARIPSGTAVGAVRVSVTDRRGRRSNALTLTVIAPPRAPAPLARPEGPPPSAFAGNALWIWELRKAEGGDLEAIATRAKLAGISTVLVKAGDRTNPWAQFNAELVGGLHERGLRACAWQYVVGDRPEEEAAVAVAAIRAGADCFVIDAEGEYSGRYAEAARYVAALRAGAGADYPIGLSSFRGSTRMRACRTPCSSAPAGRRSRSRRCTGRTSAPALMR